MEWMDTRGITKEDMIVEESTVWSTSGSDSEVMFSCGRSTWVFISTMGLSSTDLWSSWPEKHERIEATLGLSTLLGEFEQKVSSCLR